LSFLFCHDFLTFKSSDYHWDHLFY
jgi:hypothetical protein